MTRRKTWMNAAALALAGALAFFGAEYVHLHTAMQHVSHPISYSEVSRPPEPRPPVAQKVTPTPAPAQAEAVPLPRLQPETLRGRIADEFDRVFHRHRVTVTHKRRAKAKLIEFLQPAKAPSPALWTWEVQQATH